MAESGSPRGPKKLRSTTYIKKRAAKLARQHVNRLIRDYSPSDDENSSPSSCAQHTQELNLRVFDDVPQEEDTSRRSGSDMSSENVLSDSECDVVDNNEVDPGGGSPSASSEEDSIYEDDTLRAKLAQWSVSYQITLEASSALLRILQPHHPELPVTAEALRHTPKRKVDVKDLLNGKYSHLGFQNAVKCLKKSGAVEGDELVFDINIDGLRIHKSVNEECWPILSRCHCLNHGEPFVVGIFYGGGKPTPIEDFLADFIREVQDMERDGIECEGEKYSFRIRYFLCDAPARAYIKCVKGHTSSDGCERCEQGGADAWDDWVYSVTCGPLRTDQSFKDKIDIDHHKGTSPLEDQLDMKFITQFPLDPMHLVDLGVLRRFLDFLMGRGYVTARISGREKLRLNALIEEASEFIPSEFARKPRSLKFFAKWKATECRQFLLYVGPVVLREIAKRNVYKCFLLLHSAIFILSCESLKDKFHDLAEVYLQNFVPYSAELFGQDFVSYNIHSLLHLCDDVSRYGILSSFSAYPFENYLGHIKNLVKSTARPLQQICKRLEEHQIIGRQKCKRRARGFLLEHYEGPTENMENVISQYQRFEHSTFVLRLQKPDNCVKFKNGQIGLLKNIMKCQEEENVVTKVLTKDFCDCEDLYKYPIESGKLGILRVWNPSPTLILHDFSDIETKCVCLPMDGSFVVLPLLHLIPYHIVDYCRSGDEDDSKETAVIPDYWLTPNKTKAFWPRKYSEAALKLKPNEKWHPPYNIKLRATFDSYQIARETLKYADHTDALESAIQHQTVKRKAKRPHRYKECGSDHSSNEELPPPPVIKQRKKVLTAPSQNHRSVTLHDQKKPKHQKETLSRSPPSNGNTLVQAHKNLQGLELHPFSLADRAKKNLFRDKPADPRTHNPDSSLLFGSMPSSPHTQQHLNDSSLLFGSMHSSPHTQQHLDGLLPFTTSTPTRGSPALLGRSKRRTPIRLTNQNPDGEYSAARCMDAQKTKQGRKSTEDLKIEGVKAVLQEVLKKQNCMELVLENQAIMLADIFHLVGGTAKESEKPAGWPKNLPLKSLQEFLQFEDFLKKKSNHKFAVDYVAVRGRSQDWKDMTRYVCKLLISPHLRPQLNWQGSEQKTGLKNKQLGTLIIDAVLSKHATVGAAKIGSTISQWLRNNLKRTAAAAQQNADGSEVDESDA